MEIRHCKLNAPIQSFVPTNTYHSFCQADIQIPTYSQFISQSDYANRGSVCGSKRRNAHAFFLGILKQKWSGQGTYEKALLDGGDHAKELQAFIPKNALPYLRYLPEQDYCHLYSVDASTSSLMQALTETQMMTNRHQLENNLLRHGAGRGLQKF